MQTDGIYRYREDAPPKHAEKWWEEGVRMLSAMVLGFLVSELRHRGFDGWQWASILAAIIVTGLAIQKWRTARKTAD